MKILLILTCYILIAGCGESDPDRDLRIANERLVENLKGCRDLTLVARYETSYYPYYAHLYSCSNGRVFESRFLVPSAKVSPKFKVNE